MDASEVTNQQFEGFIKSTGYQTEAEIYGNIINRDNNHNNDD